MVVVVAEGGGGEDEGGEDEGDDDDSEDKDCDDFGDVCNQTTIKLHYITVCNMGQIVYHYPLAHIS